MPENDTFPLDPDYGLSVDETDGVVRQRAEGGRAIQWQQRPAQRIFTLPFEDRPTDDVELLRDWKRRFAASFFVFNHKVWVNNAGTYLARKFPVEWLDDTLPHQLNRNESYDFQVRLIEGVGRMAAKSVFANTGFDRWTASALDSWTNPGGADGAGGAEERLDTFSGSAYKISGDGASAVRGMRTQAAATIIKAGKTYTAVLRAKRSSGLAAGILTLDLFGTGVDTTGIELAFSSLSTSFQRFTAEIAGGGLAGVPNNLLLRLFLQSTPTNLESVIVDQLLIVEGSVAGDIVLPDPAQGHPSVLLQETEAALKGSGWFAQFDTGFSGGSQLLSRVASDEIIFTYSGCGFRLRGAEGPDRGQAEIYLDGSLLSRLDTYAAGFANNQVLFEKLDVALGLHTVKVKVLGTKDAASSDQLVAVDAVEFLP